MVRRSQWRNDGNPGTPGAPGQPTPRPLSSREAGLAAFFPPWPLLADGAEFRLSLRLACPNCPPGDAVGMASGRGGSKRGGVEVRKGGGSSKGDGEKGRGGGKVEGGGRGQGQGPEREAGMRRSARGKRPSGVQATPASSRRLSDDRGQRLGRAEQGRTGQATCVAGNQRSSIRRRRRGGSASQLSQALGKLQEMAPTRSQQPRSLGLASVQPAGQMTPFELGPPPSWVLVPASSVWGGRCECVPVPMRAEAQLNALNALICKVS